MWGKQIPSFRAFQLTGASPGVSSCRLVSRSALLTSSATGDPCNEMLPPAESSSVISSALLGGDPGDHALPSTCAAFRLPHFKLDYGQSSNKDLETGEVPRPMTPSKKAATEFKVQPDVSSLPGFRNRLHRRLA